MVTSIGCRASAPLLTEGPLAPVNAPVDSRGLTGDCTGASCRAARDRSDMGNEARTGRIFLIRGAIAIAWAAVFAAVADSLTVGVGVLLVLYPVIDLIASLIDARTQHGSARQLLLANAAVSAVAAVALGVAATGTVSDVFAVFGIWAGLTGAAQLVVVLRRRAQLGNQWPLVLANGVSVIGGIAFISAAVAADDPKVRMLAIYAATGGIEFVVQAWLLARRRRVATAPAQA
jgi:uncharacterized membrane protein HdeD (DUF308 family)